MQQTNFSNFITFGDSLADVGNVYLLTRGSTPESPPYSCGRFSNGELVPEIIARENGLSASVPFLAGGDNYAFATAETGSGLSDEGLPNVGEQIKFYLARDEPTATDVFFISAGSNNFFPDNDAEASAENIPAPENVLQGLTENITTLANAGAKNFMIPNLAPLGTTPYANDAGISDELNAASAEFNTLLDDELDELEDELGINIIELDIASEIAQIRENPEEFGLTNIDAPAYNSDTGAIVSNASEYFWWDEVHPTTTAYSLIAEGLFDSIPSSPAVSNIVPLSIDYDANSAGYLIPSKTGDRPDIVFNLESNNEYLNSFGMAENIYTTGVEKTNTISIDLGREFTKDLWATQNYTNEFQTFLEGEEESENAFDDLKFAFKLKGIKTKEEGRRKKEEGRRLELQWGFKPQRNSYTV